MKPLLRFLALLVFTQSGQGVAQGEGEIGVFFDEDGTASSRFSSWLRVSQTALADTGLAYLWILALLLSGGTPIPVRTMDAASVGRLRNGSVFRFANTLRDLSSWVEWMWRLSASRSSCRYA